MTALLYALTSLAVIGVETLFPLFAATTTEYEGLQYSTSRIGAVFLIASVCLFFVQLTVTSQISQHYGSRLTYIGSSLMLILFASIIPTTYLISEETPRFVYAIFILSMNQIGINSLFVNIAVLLNNSVSADVYGMANGIAATAASVGNATAPFVFGYLYSWSLKNIKNVALNPKALGFPFNQYLSFIVTGLLFFTCAMIALFALPSSKTKNDDDKPSD